ncbi:cobalt-precorrin-5B (C(1))-methyltransferase [uncultured Methanoregula sp.]|uniref:cobalt-precorrin-5B (C(1))-methyltransferase n=1 Tax=uncultured Methanoregula sp. TaxID=1005933 RepID=UPI002AABDDBC|nr:cobalt-precorrin-5B (C(1))-methyltransferase [uncultured Methanoregula sp.]
MRDPVTGFDYPATWVSRCPDEKKLLLAAQGLGVLTASGTVLLRGFTTGTTAAAAAKAAVLSLSSPVSSVRVHIPCGLYVDVPVNGRAGSATCEKYAGDYPADVTAGIEFIAAAVPAKNGISLHFGEGIGRFSRDTVRYRKNDPAVSPAAHACIRSAVEEAQRETGLPGVTVSIRIPRGAAVALHTLNPRIGVEEGISVLGTTGLVEPWDDHLTESTITRIAKTKDPVLTTGRVGLRYSRLLFPDRDVILVGGKIGETLAVARGSVVLCGLPALILRHIRPQILEGTGYRTVEELSVSPAFKEIMKRSLADFKIIRPDVRVVLLNRDGTILGETT